MMAAYCYGLFIIPVICMLKILVLTLNRALNVGSLSIIVWQRSGRSSMLEHPAAAGSGSDVATRCTGCTLDAERLAAL